jgi:hypothetical protein
MMMNSITQLLAILAIIFSMLYIRLAIGQLKSLGVKAIAYDIIWALMLVLLLAYLYL